MLHRTIQASGHTIHASHIEAAAKEFTVEFDSPAYTNVLYFEAGKRWGRVLAETEAGALAIARYHYGCGSNFKLRSMS